MTLVNMNVPQRANIKSCGRSEEGCGQAENENLLLINVKSDGTKTAAAYLHTSRKISVRAKEYLI
jgi:hypothetical protein